MIYYNDNDPKACAWLRELIAAGELPAGDVDCRSITEIKKDDLTGYDQCHFFAGVGGWALALRWAGLEGVSGIWTGSCPCQPLSCAGKRQGHADERHLWPAFHALISERRPATVFGEQVASKDGREWFAGVRLDLEGLGYACGGADLCAAGVGAPHRRQRLYWVADADNGRLQIGRAENDGALRAVHCGRNTVAVQRTETPESGTGAMRVADGLGAGLEGHAGNERDGREPGRDGAEAARHAAEGGATGRMADAAGARHTGAGTGAGDDGDGKDQDAHGKRCVGQPPDGGGLGNAKSVNGGLSVRPENGEEDSESFGAGENGGLGNASGRGCGVGGDAPQPRGGGHADGTGGAGAPAGGTEHAGHGAGCAVHGQQREAHDAGGRQSSPWGDFDILPCRDGKSRRVESQPLTMADGVSAHLDALRNAGLSEDEIGAAVSTFPLTQHAVGRMMLLRGYGNAISPQLAAEFIEAWKSTRGERQ